ncbi:MAG: hypothetical protein HKN35_12820 [Woeseia sp.]|nr:hypothetical protein [Woeseia sp.]MBT8095779.1 hypothetical protein [Woeseia sp.]NNE61771.1 hypothetical protein [Woeseia sp.]NNL54184.1 hypothetical protein [Woeseia sp.]
MSYRWHDFVGNIGVLLILVSYLLLQLGRLKVSNLAYSVINGLGACLILVSLLFEFNFSAFIVEAAWLLISLFGVARCLRRRTAVG